jgi:hypothetical protein
MFQLTRREGGAAAAVVLALFLSFQAVAAADPAKPKPETKAVTPTTEKHTMMTAPTFTVPVTGLTQTNTAKVSEQLRAFGKEKGVVFSQITPDVTKKTITFSFAENHQVRQSDLAAAIAKAGVKVNHEMLEVPVGSLLILRGATDALATAELKTALNTAKLFESFTIEPGKTIGELMVTPVMKSAVRFTTLSADIPKAKSGYELVDFAWVTPPMPKA